MRSFFSLITAILLAQFSVVVHSAEGNEYSPKFLIKKSIEKVMDYKSAYEEFDRLGPQYGGSCGGSQSCWDKAYARAADVSGYKRKAEEAAELCNAAANAFQKKPYKLSEDERYELNKTCYSTLGHSRFVESKLGQLVK